MFNLFIIFAILYIVGRLNGWYIRNIRFDGIYFYYTVRIWNPVYNEWNTQVISICLWKYGTKNPF
jgi:hypothetical protein